MDLKHTLLRRIGHLYWLRFGVRDRIIRFFNQSDTAPHQEFTVSFYGKTYHGNLSSFVDWSVFYYGAYEYQELQLIKDILTAHEKPVFIDVGANVGNHSLFAASCQAQVIAFEPVPALYGQLKSRIDDNKLDTVRVYNYALGATTGTASFMPSVGSNQGTGKVISDSTDNANTINVNVVQGDSFLEDCGLENVSLIKIDVEGYEPYVLEGLTTTLNKYRPVVFFEWSDESNNNSKSHVTHLFPDNYSFFTVKKHRPKFLFFEHKDYQLIPVDGLVSDAYYLAIPDESIELFQANHVKFI